MAVKRSGPISRRSRIRTRSPKKATYRQVRALWGKIVRESGPCIIPGCPLDPQACHYWPEGKYKRVAIDLENGFPCCYKHHIHGWHKDPEVQQQIKDLLLSLRGQVWYDRLKLKRDTSSRPDLTATRLYFESILRKSA